MFVLGLSCDVVTRRKFMRFVGSAAQSDMLLVAARRNVEKRIVWIYVYRMEFYQPKDGENLKR